MKPSRPYNSANSTAAGCDRQSPVAPDAMSITVPLDAALAPEDSRLLRRLGQRATRHGFTLWLVGGPVRDALLGLPIRDIDLTAERPAAEIALALMADVDDQVVATSQFSTAKAVIEGRKLDIAMARTEHYPHPGALPLVAPGTIEEDSLRRDFSINAMAACLAPGRFGELLDVTGGRRDLLARRLRALHDASFRDDATRLIRAARYAHRMRLRPASGTAEWLRRDLGYLSTISPPRVHHEFWRTLDEADAAGTVLHTYRLGVLGALHPALARDETPALLRRAKRHGLHGDALFAALVYGVEESHVGTVAERFALTNDQRTLVDGVVLAWSSRDAHVDGLRDALGRVPPDAVRVAAASTSDPAFRRRLLRVLRHRLARPLLTGDDIMALGVPQGQAVGRLLSIVRDAQWSGLARTRAGAVAIVQRHLRAMRQ